MVFRVSLISREIRASYIAAPGTFPAMKKLKHPP
jgi:hypothetical protein